MSNIGTVSRTALRAVADEANSKKKLVSSKIIGDIEDNPNEASHRLCQDLRRVLKSVVADPNATGEEVRECGLLLTRVRHFDPRRQKVNGISEANQSEQSRPGRVARAVFDQDSWMTEQLSKTKSTYDPDYSRKLFEELKSRA